MKRVLVTGGRGLVGQAVVAALQARGVETHATARSPTAGLAKHAETHMVDLLAPGAPERLIQEVRPDTLIHLAWITDHGEYWNNPLNHAWRVASLALFDAFLRLGGERAVAAGTSAEYAWTGDDRLHEERTPLEPASAYGAEKLNTWREAEPRFQKANVPLGWARFFGPFGPGEDRRRLIPKTCLRLLAGESLTFDAALEQRDFLHTSEIAHAVLAIADHDHHGPVNVASGEPRTVREVVETIAHEIGADSRVAFARPRTAPGVPVVASVDLLRDVLGWQPERDFDKQIAATVSWWRANPSKKQDS